MRQRPEDFALVRISVLRQNDLEASHSYTCSSLLVLGTPVGKFPLLTSEAETLGTR